MTDLLELISKRESCRRFDAEKKVDNELIKKCLEAARLAPSARNSQPWHFIAVNKPSVSLSVSRCLQDGGANAFASDVPAFVIVCEKSIEIMSDGSVNKEKQKHAHGDVGIAVGYFTLEAASLGLSTCILGWLNDEKLRKAVSIPSDEKVRVVIAVGYSENGSVRPKIRKELESIADIIE